MSCSAISCRYCAWPGDFRLDDAPDARQHDAHLAGRRPEPVARAVLAEAEHVVGGHHQALLGSIDHALGNSRRVLNRLKRSVDGERVTPQRHLYTKGPRELDQVCVVHAGQNE
jgi:hypothetical protein